MIEICNHPIGWGLPRMSIDDGVAGIRTVVFWDPRVSFSAPVLQLPRSKKRKIVRQIGF